MSFGYSIGDFIATAQLANSIRKRYADAPKQFQDLFNELRSLSIVLQDVDILAGDELLDFQRARQLQDISQTCRTVLVDIEKAIYKYGTVLEPAIDLRQRAKRTWKKLTWEPDDIRDLRSRLKSNIELLNTFISTSNTISSLAIREKLEQVVDQQDLARREQLISWISDIDYEAIYADALSSRQEQTSWQWVLDTKEVLRWFDNVGDTLYCTGAPGIGKTVMTSVLIERLRARYHDSEKVAVVHVFFNYNRPEQHKPIAVLSNILVQLLRSGLDIPKSLKNQSAAYQVQGKRFTSNELFEHVKTCCSYFTRTFIVLDALDECDEEYRPKVLEHIFRLQRQNDRANLFATSRPLPIVVELFSGLPRMTLRAHDDDLKTFLRDRAMSMNLVRKDPTLLDLILDDIVRAADGVFLLARLHMDSLQSKRTTKALKAALVELPFGSTAYDVAYEQAMTRVRTQPIDCCIQAMDALRWIVCAQSELSPRQLQHALAIEDGSTELDVENEPDIDDIITVCVGLVELNTQTDVIRLVHYSAREFFSRHRDGLFPNADTRLAQDCITYLCLDIFGNGSCTSDALATARIIESPLYTYAASNWGHHARNAHLPYKRAQPLLSDIAKLNASVQMTDSYREYMLQRSSQDFSQPMTTALHICSFFALEDYVSILLPETEDPNIIDHYGRTAVHIAGGWTNSISLLKIFLADPRVDLATQERKGNALIHTLARFQKNDIFLMLLSDPRVDLNASGYYGQTVLHICAGQDNFTAVKALLALNKEKQILDVNALDKDGHTPLARAARLNPNIEMVKLLMSDPSIKLTGALRAAVSVGSKANVITIVQEFQHRSAIGMDSGEPLTESLKGCLFEIRGKDRGMLRLLLEAGADVNEKDRFGHTIMENSVFKGNPSFVKVLLEWEEREQDFSAVDKRAREMDLWTRALAIVGKVSAEDTKFE